MHAVSIDPVTLAVLQGRFEQVVNEMDATLFRIAFNPIIAEAHDASHGIYDRDSGSAAPSIRSLLRRMMPRTEFTTATAVRPWRKANQACRYSSVPCRSR